MRPFWTALPLFFVTLALASPAGAADGDFDPAFDLDGWNIYAAPGDYWNRLLLAPDGAAVAWGRRWNATSAQEIHWRRLTDGGLGTLCTWTSAGATLMAPSDATFDSEGRLVVAGTVDYGAGPVLGVARFLYPACTLDPDFDGGGFAVHDLDLDDGAISFVSVAAVRWYSSFPLQQRRLLIAIRRVAHNEEDQAWLVRLRDDGTIDTGFGGGDGELLLATERGPYQIVVAHDGRLLVGGRKGTIDDEDTFVRKVDRDGVADGTFGVGGEATVDFSPAGDSSDVLWRLTAAPDGRIVLAGSTDYNPEAGAIDRRPAVAILTASGLPDPSFSGDGRTFLGTHGWSTMAFEAEMQGDGRILLATSTQVASEIGFIADLGHVVRLTRSGQQDATFGAGGEVAIDWNEVADGKDNVSRLRLGSDGRIWASGVAEVPNGGETQSRAWVARLQNSYLFADGFERGSTANW
jgi:uncharacterized delta-60 repeat protein